MEEKQWFERFTSNDLQDAFAYCFESMFKGFGNPFGEPNLTKQSLERKVFQQNLDEAEEVEFEEIANQLIN